MDYRRYIARNLINMKGWKTRRKIVVIESDDWGSIRMPSFTVYNKFKELDIRVSKDPYSRYDSLASSEDLEALYNVLSKFKDHKGNHPIITANTIVANPDFQKIRDSDFKEYYYECFTETLSKYPAHRYSFNLWKEGIESSLFHPQFHGREHLNVPLWMKLLQHNISPFIEAFNNKFWSLHNIKISKKSMNIQAAYDSDKKIDKEFQVKSVLEGLDLFRKIFGYNSLSFIAPNYIWDSSLELVANDKNVQFIQGMKYQKFPINQSLNRKKIRHFLGEKNKFGQIYLVRNCIFEPSFLNNPNLSLINCLKDIETAFRWNKPAIICSHRLNFIGYISAKNRDVNLNILKKMFQKILKKWPEVEFVSSDMLGEIIKRSDKIG